MKTTTLIGVASALVRSKRYKILFVGAQFAYLGYQLVKKHKRKKRDENSLPKKK
ncbi:Hypothetical protein I595_1796 [Croceitalea dokdonensis DOKDO 023]|uniref:Uncharacterized protein n=1 Tax=Croceitalea dokdonensis DOKDO 023 TaxID=1300341 RepID=A0A0P7AVX6_9FLAO|nr:hypothetical protein [Croceitalea dokdonensis]KPM32147.1 Hypothetical protein I595_1796 [Croceitalea dokdonensis DOKDO 023]